MKKQSLAILALTLSSSILLAGGPVHSMAYDRGVVGKWSLGGGVIEGGIFTQKNEAFSITGAGSGDLKTYFTPGGFFFTDYRFTQHFEGGLFFAYSGQKHQNYNFTAGALSGQTAKIGRAHV